MELSGPRRRPSAGGYARGDVKRVKIIEAALRVFGEQGFERASTRQIAQDAGVNPPALQYYFESKEGLHLACVEHIANQMEQALGPVFEAADAITSRDPGAAVEALCGIMDALAELMFGKAQEGWSRFLARGQGEGNGPAYKVMRQRIAGAVHARCCRLVGLATGNPSQTVQTDLRTIAILGQLSVFHLSREHALTVLGWEDFREERLQMLKDVVNNQIWAILAPNLHGGCAVPGRDAVDEG